MNTSSGILRWTLGFACCLPGLFSSFAVAQGPAKKEAPAAPAELWFEVTVTRVKPDKVAEFERLFKEELNPALKKGGLPWRNVFTRATFGEAYEYVWVAPIARLGQYDETAPLYKALRTEEANALRAKIHECHVSTRASATRLMSDLTFTTTPGPGPIAVVSVYQIAPGRKAEWRKFMHEEYVPVIKKSDLMGFEAHETMFGGNADEIVTIGWWRNYADLEKGPPIERVLGVEGAAKLMQKLPTGVILHTDRFIQRLREDLSIQPDPATP